MLRTRCKLVGLRARTPRQYIQVANFASASPSCSPYQPNAPLDLDPSLRDLLNHLDDKDMSLGTSAPRSIDDTPDGPRELELFPHESNVETAWTEDGAESREDRKSPAAIFGSRGIGAVILPNELVNSVNHLVELSDKPMLHADAKRLFSEGDDNSIKWLSSYNTEYTSKTQESRHSERDGTAFASVVLPAHYSAIYSVLDHVKNRMGPSWDIRRVIDWGAGTGSGLWASAYSFQKRAPDNDSPVEDLVLDHSAIESYVGIDKREGLLSIAKRLLQNVRRPGMVISWQKSFQTDDKIPRSKAGDVLALSAFMLSSILAPLSRKIMVKEMWDSGAHTIVIIDHNSPLGFECISEARRYLLDMGAREMKDPETENWDVRGAHVVAPCPHDGVCPLYHVGRDRFLCGFEQRFQRPAFVRKTKHSGVGHEDIGYSYVVIRRGPRPKPISSVLVGRVGQVGREELERAKEKRLSGQRELLVSGESEKVEEAVDTAIAIGTETEELDIAPDVMEAALMSESYKWPRLVFSPLKKSGHVILDCCTAEGKIVRMTIPKSQGKQPYYDARRSQWGDLFPHGSKNKLVQRFPLQPGVLIKGRGKDVSKWKDYGKPKAFSYENMSDILKRQRWKGKQEKDRSLKREEKKRLNDSSYDLTDA